MDEQVKAMIKKDIFVAVIANGSIRQKENWLDTAMVAAQWILPEDTSVKNPKSKVKK